MRTSIKLLAAISFAVVMLTGFSKPLKADQWNKRTIVTINEPIQVPNVVLGPGTYVFKIWDSNYRHVVFIYNKDETKLITTVLANPNERMRIRGRSEFDFYETQAGQPLALRAWFYPGDNFGHSFVYGPGVTQRTATTSASSVVGQ